MRAALVYAVREHAERRATAAAGEARKALFSGGGRESAVVLREGAYEGFVWFTRQYAVDFVVPEELVSADWWQTKKFLVRRERGGPVHYRTEPMYHDDWFVLPPEAYTDADPAHIASPMLAHDCLYNHFQTEKYAEWWKAPGLPSTPLGANELLYVDKERGAWVWDERGRILFNSSSESSS
ncbi:uncharacterized protein PHACADRAFT_259066 [Phanerochaete carnosa HHB-10118-sp]|uniref:Uncharacterized protein n=1 Tax=Phanerochaete carnosa (strain HHB-10118-sp) TaxID=650164 RepID=K5UXT5_PHACS|nr:uncharacterized protein PHACADRAFT_259066 [Phanerochaete carnosa HHB-10118-sp]EKM54901.1 hypothetical protein PHACADRAFT_259066 [Phanerochaete carnosa HHB-10118-sp]